MDKVELPVLKGEDKEKYIPTTLIFGFAILLFVFVAICLSLTIKRQYVLEYSESSYLDYNVFLKDNDKYTEKRLGKDRVYVASLIDYVSADFNYTFNSMAPIGIEYNYYVNAAVEVNNSAGKNIYKKEESLINSKNFESINGHTFKISENLKIDYDKYNKIATDFKKEYAPNADANLVVSLYTNVIGKHADFDKKINDNAVITLIIPLTNDMIEIKMDYDLSNKYDDVLQYRAATVRNEFLFKTAIVVAVIDLIAMVSIIVWVIKSRDPLTLYKKKLNRILKDYDRYISETIITQRVEDMLITKSLRIELVKTFEGLIDIRDNLNVPILYHEERPGLEAVFYIVTDQIGYIYVMKADDFKKKKNDNINNTSKNKTNSKSTKK